MGTFGEFRNFSKQLSAQLEGYAKLKSMISPFMLWRVKTDKRIISDLPDKLETVDYVEMSRKQVVLYRKAVADMEKKILHADGIERRGLVLATIMKLKQICNHPDQYLVFITDSHDTRFDDYGKVEIIGDFGSDAPVQTAPEGDTEGTDEDEETPPDEESPEDGDTE